MSEFKESLAKIERLLNVAQSHSPGTHHYNLYDFLGIDRTASKENIKASVEQKYNFYLAKQNGSDPNSPATLLITSLPAIEYVLSECQSEYDKHLLDLKVKQLRNHFVAMTRANHELGNNERKHLIDEGVAIGLSETQAGKIIDLWMKGYGIKPSSDSSSNPAPDAGKTYYEIFGIANDADDLEIKKAYEQAYQLYLKTKDETRWSLISKGWEILKDADKRKAYDKKINPSEIKHGSPLLKVICKKEGFYVYKDVKKGTTFTEAIVIKNDRDGQLKGGIFSDAEWLAPGRDRLIDENEQILELQILTSKIPANNYEARATLTIDTNGGPPFLLPFTVILEDLDIAADKFRKAYVPLLAACAGLTASFNDAPFTGLKIADSLIIALLAGLIAFFSANVIVKVLLKNNLNIFNFPSVLIQSAAAGVALLAILSISPAVKPKIGQEKPDQTVNPEPEPLSKLPKAENKPVTADQAVFLDSPAPSTGDILKDTFALTGKLTQADSTGNLWQFGLDAAETHYGFSCNDSDELHFRVGGDDIDYAAGTNAIKTLPSPVTLYFRKPDSNIVQNCASGSSCALNLCPVAIVIDANAHAQNIQHQPSSTEVENAPNINTEQGKTLPKKTSATTKTVKKKKRKPKIKSFAPPSRDDL
jgi:hypothetical protein